MDRVYLAQFRGLVTLVCATLLFSSASPVIAEVRSPLTKQGNLEVQCAYCEQKDSEQKRSCLPRNEINYCSCRGDSEAATRILLKEGKGEWAGSAAFIERKVKELQKKLKKAKKSKKAIQKAVAQLRKKLATQHDKFLEQCLADSGVVVGPVGPGGGLTQVARKGSRTLYVFGGGAVRHSFAFDVTERGAISGALYTSEPTPDPELTQRSFVTGLRIKQHGVAPYTPFVLSRGRFSKMCDNCLGVQIGALNDTNSVALGMKNIAVPGISPSGIVFNYATGVVADIPSVGGKPVVTSDINETGRMSGSVANPDGTHDAVLWTNGQAMQLSRSSILDALDVAAAPLYLEEIKAELRRNKEQNECGDAEINSTKLVGQHRRLSPPAIFGGDLTNNGYVMGTIVGGQSEWDFTGLCQSGTHQIASALNTFMVTPDNALHVIPNNSLQYDGDDRRFAVGTAINSFGKAVGTALNDILRGFQLVTLDVKRGDRLWTLHSFEGLNTGGLVASGINDQGDIVGASLRETGRMESRAFAVLNGVFTDLTKFMEIRPDSGLVLETATANNNCGVIVGTAWNEKTQQNHLFVLAPDGCPIPS